MICPNCGNANTGNSKFCPLCGVRLDLDSNNASAEQPKADAQGGYTPPVAPVVFPTRDVSPLSVGQFVLMDFLMMLPIANLVLLFVWGFGSNENENRRNWARAKLIWLLIGIGITIIVAILAFTFGISAVRYASDILRSVY